MQPNDMVAELNGYDKQARALVANARSFQGLVRIVHFFLQRLWSLQARIAELHQGYTEFDDAFVSQACTSAINSVFFAIYARLSYLESSNPRILDGQLDSHLLPKSERPEALRFVQLADLVSFRESRYRLLRQFNDFADFVCHLNVYALTSLERNRTFSLESMAVRAMMVHPQLLIGLVPALRKEIIETQFLDRDLSGIITRFSEGLKPRYAPVLLEIGTADSRAVYTAAQQLLRLASGLKPDFSLLLPLPAIRNALMFWRDSSIQPLPLGSYSMHDGSLTFASIFAALMQSPVRGCSVTPSFHVGVFEQASVPRSYWLFLGGPWEFCANYDTSDWHEYAANPLGFIAKRQGEWSDSLSVNSLARLEADTAEALPLIRTIGLGASVVSAPSGNALVRATIVAMATLLGQEIARRYGIPESLRDAFIEALQEFFVSIAP